MAHLSPDLESPRPASRTVPPLPLLNKITTAVGQGVEVELVNGGQRRGFLHAVDPETGCVFLLVQVRIPVEQPESQGWVGRENNPASVYGTVSRTPTPTTVRGRLGDVGAHAARRLGVGTRGHGCSDAGGG